MNDLSGNPIIDQASETSWTPLPIRSKVTPEIARIIADLCRRFPASSTVNPADEAQRAKLLAQDIADIPASILELGVRAWVRTKAFMPKAAELRTISYDADRALREERARVRTGNPNEPWRNSEGKTNADLGNERWAAECARRGHPYRPMWMTDNNGKCQLAS